MYVLVNPLYSIVYSEEDTPKQWDGKYYELKKLLISTLFPKWEIWVWLKFILDFEFNLLQVRSISKIKIILFQTLLKTVLQFTLLVLAFVA